MCVREREEGRERKVETEGGDRGRVGGGRRDKGWEECK